MNVFAPGNFLDGSDLASFFFCSEGSFVRCFRHPFEDDKKEMKASSNEFHRRLWSLSW